MRAIAVDGFQQNDPLLSIDFSIKYLIRSPTHHLLVTIIIGLCRIFAKWVKS